MSPLRHPMPYYFTNKFVITEHSSYFFPYRMELCFPPMIENFREIFDLDDPEVYREVRVALAVGKTIVGIFVPKEVVIEVPLEKRQYTEKRIREVFGR